MVTEATTMFALKLEKIWRKRAGNFKDAMVRWLDLRFGIWEMQLSLLLRSVFSSLVL